MTLIENIREFLKDNKIDYLLVNSTNEYLVEYNELEANSRYFLTNFSGSTGDALISQKDIFLFVDSRYHQQADQEVDKNLVTVVKLKIGESLTNAIEQKIKPNKTFALVSKKNSQGRYEILQGVLSKKNIDIKLLDSDPIKTKDIGKSKSVENIDISITGLSIEEKIKKIAKKLKDDEAILITNLEEISYLLNIRDFSKNYSSKIQSGKLLIKKDSWDLLDVVESDKIRDLNKIFVDKTTITSFDYAILGDKVESILENHVKLMKSIKTNSEIKHYKKCFERTDCALFAIRDYIEQNDNLSEYDIEKKLEENFYKFGAKSLSFKSIVAKDKNSALAHYSKNSQDEILKDGSLVLIDCGAYYEGGYATDCTRVFVKGTPTNLQKQIYTIVLKGFLKAFNKKITPTTSGLSLDKAARKVLNSHKPEGFEFSHSLGHGIGINVHEAPPSLAFSPTAKTPLKPNMCFTIEPGLYKKSFGGVRLENSCYLTEEDGKFIIKSLTNMCFEEKLIDFDLLTPTEKKQLKAFPCK